MTVVSNQTHNGPFTADGAVTTFPFTFEVSAPSEVKVELGGVELNSSLYTVSLNDDGTGSVTFYVAPVGSLFLYSDPAFDQPTKLENQGPYLQKTLEAALDREAIKSIYLEGLSRRSLKTPLGEEAQVLPPAAERAGGFLSFGPTGDFLRSAGTGADEGLRTDLVGSGGTARVGHKGYAPGIIRALSAILQDGLALKKDFGAVGNGTMTMLGADDSAAVAQAIADCVGLGTTLYIEPGHYQCGVIDQTLSTNNFASAGPQFSIIGAGRNDTGLIFNGTKDETHIRLKGNATNQQDHLRISGLRFLRPDGGYMGLGTGSALALENLSDFTLDDLVMYRQGRAVYAVGCLLGKINKVHASYCKEGFRFEQGPYVSTPNVIRLEHCEIIAPGMRGIVMNGGSNFAATDCTVEGCGIEAKSFGYPDGQPIGVELTGAGGAGGVGAVFNNCYFENGRGLADVYIDHNHGLHATYGFKECSFNRFGIPEDKVAHNITLDASTLGAGGPQIRLDIRGSAFIGYGAAFVPDAAQSYLSWNLGAGYDGCEFDETNTIYSHAVEKAVVPGNVIRRPGPEFSAFITGASAVFGFGVVSASWIAAGICQITLARTPASITDLSVSVTTDDPGASGFFANIAGLSGNVLTVRAYDAAGTPSSTSILLRADRLS